MKTLDEANEDLRIALIYCDIPAIWQARHDIQRVSDVMKVKLDELTKKIDLVLKGHNKKLNAMTESRDAWRKQAELCLAAAKVMSRW